MGGLPTALSKRQDTEYGSRRSPGYRPAKKSNTIRQNLCGACSNIGCVVPGIITVFELGTCAASICSTCGSAPLVLAPPMNSVGVLIASASALENGGGVCRGWAAQEEAMYAQLCL